MRTTITIIAALLTVLFVWLALLLMVANGEPSSWYVLCWIIFSILATAIGGVVGNSLAYKDGGDPLAWTVFGIIIGGVLGAACGIMWPLLSVIGIAYLLFTFIILPWAKRTP